MQNKHNKPGWYENPDPRTGKAPKHRMVALREQYKGTLRTGIVPADVIAKTQAKRTDAAIRQDAQKTADIVLEQGKQEDVLQWAKNPSKYDLRGVDTKNVSNPHKYSVEKKRISELDNEIDKQELDLGYSENHVNIFGDDASRELVFKNREKLQNLRIEVLKLKEKIDPNYEPSDGSIEEEKEYQEKQKIIRKKVQDNYELLKEEKYKIDKETRMKESKEKEELEKRLTTSWERAVAETKKRGLRPLHESGPTKIADNMLGFSDVWKVPKYAGDIIADRKVKSAIKKLEKERPSNNNEAHDAVNRVEKILHGTGDAVLVNDRKTKAKEVLDPYDKKNVKRWQEDYLNGGKDNVDLKGVDDKR
ncbi:MAG: hypothetical protein OIN86_13005 [Candidatus Methanoperedens sp.]|nr:hypothetical protein [Candidatus Methanoperedens sp.]CAG0948779.1 hypothetical protein METP1_00056 [Methanosarcinales archaeon]